MGSVFINYRSVDNPWGAAGIHEWLAQRISGHRVFRDCVSLDAGAHYPSAVMTELEEADLLIAVIGPRWLAVTDSKTGQRLIDRDNDWVRRELALAFQRGIPVLPVLLRDTPEDARQPAPEDLPDDIRRLATLQACKVSQRRLRADLDSLTEQVLRILSRATTAPPPPARAPRIPREAFFSLVDALEAVPCLFSEGTRALLINELPPAIAGAVRYSPQRRLHAMSIVRTCLDYEGGLADMIAALCNIEGNESIPVRHLVAITRGLPPGLRPPER